MTDSLPRRSNLRVLEPSDREASGNGHHSLHTPDRRARISGIWLAVRVLAALALLSVGAVHLKEYTGLYSQLPTIGTLFVLNFAGATLLGFALLAPLDRIGGRWGSLALVLSSAGGIGLAATSFVLLLISQHTPLFGFMEPGYDPAGILAAQVSEVVTVLLLGTYLLVRFGLRIPVRPW